MIRPLLEEIAFQCVDLRGALVTVHGSRVTNVQKRIELQKSFSGASVDHTDARNDIFSCFGRSGRSAQWGV
jgi:hypothetical protein